MNVYKYFLPAWVLLSSAAVSDVPPSAMFNSMSYTYFAHFEVLDEHQRPLSKPHRVAIKCYKEASDREGEPDWHLVKECPGTPNGWRNCETDFKVSELYPAVKDLTKCTADVFFEGRIYTIPETSYGQNFPLGYGGYAGGGGATLRINSSKGLEGTSPAVDDEAED